VAFELRPDESVARGVRRAARKEIEKSLESLTGDGAAPDEKVHDARKRLKRVRALLRLARPGMGAKAYRRENAALRDAARPLSEVRDAQALVGAVDRLRDESEGAAPLVRPVRRSLRTRQRAVRRKVVDEQGALAGVAAEMGEARRRARGWKPGGGWSVLGEGLERVYCAGRRAFREARENPTDESLHEWRKQAKYLWHALRFLEGMGGEDFRKEVGRTHDLADRLGDDHDLAVLRGLLVGKVQQSANGGGGLLPLIDRRRRQLQQEAYALGEEVYREKPKAFARRLRAQWKAWRSGAQPAEAAAR
jgi:CHAD domain-containing protein